MTLDLILFRPEFFLLFGFFVLLAYGTGNLVAPVAEILTVPSVLPFAPVQRAVTNTGKVEAATMNENRPTRGPGHAVTALTLWAISWCLLTCFLLWDSPFERIFYGGTFQKNAYSLQLCILLFRSGALVLRVSFGWQKTAFICHTEYIYLAMLAAIGQYLVLQATDLMALYLCMELQSFSLVVLCGLNSKSAYSLEAAIKYFLLSAFRSALLLLGIGFIYWQTGETSLRSIENLVNRTRTEPSLLLALGIWLVTTGLLWKLAAAPLHFWVPDVYMGAWSSVSLWITILPKIRVLGFWTSHWQRIWSVNFGPGGSTLALFRGLSIIVGAIAPLAQTNLKRLLAYSSIGHMGIILMPLCQGRSFLASTNANETPTDFFIGSSGNAAIGVMWAYIIIYIVVNLGVWRLLIREIVRPPYKKYRGPSFLWDLKGLNQSSARAAFRWAIMMASLAGLPPVYAFLGKAAVLWQSVNAGLYTLVFIALRYSIIGSVYYLKVMKICYVDTPRSWTTYSRFYPLSAYIIARSVFFMVIGLWYSNVLFLYRHTLALKILFVFYFSLKI